MYDKFYVGLAGLSPEEGSFREYLAKHRLLAEEVVIATPLTGTSLGVVAEYK